MSEIQEEEIDLREYINVLLKRKGIIILIFLIAVITAALVSYFYLKPVYQASTILMISKPKYQVELEPKIQTQFTPEVSLATYESLIKDREIEEEVIKKLNLDQPPYEFTPDSLQGMITIEALKDTNLIKMNLQSGEPKLAKDVANVWAALFVEKNKDLNLQESKEAQGFIEEQLKISDQNLSTIEEEIREFDETNNIVAMDKEITEKLNKIMANESRLADLKISAESEKAKIEEIGSQMISQEKLISSSNIDRLTEGMKFTEAKDFIESQLGISSQNLSTIEEETLKESLNIYNVILYSYVLMSNHFHFLLETSLANLSEFMRQFNITYTSYYNRRYNRVGHLYQGRYKSILIQKESYLNILSRYIHLNPVRVERMQNTSISEKEKYLRQFKWSSLKGYLY